MGMLPVVLPQAQVMVATYAGDCTTAKTVFNLQDADKTVCAKITGATPGWQAIWSNSNFVAVQRTTLTAGNQDVTFTLTANSSLGDWRVILYEPFGGTVQALTSFTVIDADNPVADVGVNKGGLTLEAAAGAQAVFGVIVTNSGPSEAVNVSLTDVVPDGTTFGRGPKSHQCVRLEVRCTRRFASSVTFSGWPSQANIVLAD